MKMKKNKLPHFLKTGILFFGIALLLWNCEKEELVPIEQVQSIKKERVSKSIPFETLEDTDVYQYFNQKLLLNLKTDKQLNHFQKGDKTTVNDLTIITQKVNQVINNGVETFSMFIKYKEHQENIYYNLVLYKKEDKYRIYTLKIENSQKNHGKGASISMNSDITVQSGIIPYDGWDDVDDTSSGGDDYEWQCWSVTLQVPYACGSGGHYPNQGCTGSPTAPYWPGYNYITDSDCGYVYIGTDSNSIDNGNDSGNTGGSGNTSDTSDSIDVDAVNPNEIVPEGALESIMECLTPNQTQLDWLNNELANNSKNVVSIWNYINENSCDNDTQDVITESIEEDIINDEEFEEIFKRKKECKKIKKLLDNYPTYKQALVNLAGTANQNHENGKFIDNSNTSVQDIPQGTGGKIDINLNPSSPYVTIAHTHDALGSGIGTYSVFSFADLLVLSSLAKKGKIKTNKFVAVLITAKGTRYALTINNTTKFKNFFYNAKLDAVNGVVNMDKFFQMRDLSKEYYGKEDAVIKENNSNNNAVKIAFLKLLQNNDTGVSVFKANANFDSFDNLKLEDDNTTVTPNNCNN
jgi:hypothetical protein